ncbi:chaperone [Lithospermum erythrorhizon]|uniref:Chaperone n=1 Tax=Lithospermum erythrorhizon TaxID=34254 RepID=A0AAV3NRU5_LITER
MEVLTIHPSSFGSCPLLFTNHFIPENYVHCTEIIDCYIYSADLSGIREDAIRVEIVESKYLSIRTEAVQESEEPARSFMRKFKLPEGMDVDNISVGYEDGFLTITVPKSHMRTGFFIHPDDMPEISHVSAKAA